MKQLVAVAVADLPPIETDDHPGLGPMDVHIWCYAVGSKGKEPFHE